MTIVDYVYGSGAANCVRHLQNSYMNIDEGLRVSFPLALYIGQYIQNTKYAVPAWRPPYCAAGYAAQTYSPYMVRSPNTACFTQCNEKSALHRPIRQGSDLVLGFRSSFPSLLVPP